MSTTARLNLPYIAPQQAQKQITYNEAMAALDQLVQPAVLSRSVTAPPGVPIEGDTFIVAPASTGAWAGKDHRFACWRDGAWHYRVPADGWLAYVAETDELAVYRAGAWESFVTNGGTSLAKLGINAEADLTTRLAVAANASLFTHDGAGHRLTLNKAAAGDTASLLYQTGFSGRAELGLAGSDDFAVKVSPDGSTWFEALSIDRASGIIAIRDDRLLLRDNADASKAAQFQLSAIATATTRTFTLPDISATLAVTGAAAQTFAGTTSFSAASVSVGTATAATYGLGTGATAAATTKAINIGTAGVSGSITNVQIGSAVAGATGSIALNQPVSLASGQLGFPAAAIPSADPNTLDDYEEGVWTPTITFGGNSVGVTYGSPTGGRYTKIGRTVVASGSVTLTSKGSSVGAAGVGNLPFASANDGIYAAAAIGMANGFSSVTAAVLGVVAPNASRITLYHANNGNGAGLTNSNFGASSQLFFTVVYDV
ncbi:MAG: DUF2793 domain-containing protein [Hyphomicrobiales bacterium]|nr:MAG: DUF2793 domain-containing protein [Hyphomicrobiales bacterium]